MTKALTARVLAIAIAAVTFGAVASDASVRFHNDSDQAIHFGLSCNGGADYQYWTVQPNATRSLYCVNGAQRARVEIRTRHDDGDRAVVHATVYDGNGYRLYFDREGDVNIY